VRSSKRTRVFWFADYPSISLWSSKIFVLWQSDFCYRSDWDSKL